MHQETKASCPASLAFACSKVLQLLVVMTHTLGMGPEWERSQGHCLGGKMPPFGRCDLTHHVTVPDGDEDT